MKKWICLSGLLVIALLTGCQDQAETSVETTAAPTVAGHSHKYSVTVVAPTCTKYGYTLYQCVCGDSFRADETKAVGHAFQETVVASNCRQQGYTVYTCDCGYSYTDNYVAIDGERHDFDEGICVRCGHRYTSQGLTYDLCDDGSGYVVTGLGECTDRTIFIPSERDGLPVREIGKSAFYQCDLTGVYLPSSIVRIDEKAFYGCNSIQKLQLSDCALEIIGDYAFYNCCNIQTVELPQSVKFIGEGAFSCCANLTQITIPDGVTFISAELLRNCINLRSVILPESLTEIGANAFRDCVALVDIKIPDNVTIIGEGAFRDCSALESLALPDGLQIIEDCTFYDCRELKNVVLPRELKQIGAFSFFNCTQLSDLVFRSGLEIVGSMAFYNCKKLTAVTFLAEPPALEYDWWYYSKVRTIYYPANHPAWTEEVLADFGYEFEFIPFEP